VKARYERLSRTRWRVTAGCAYLETARYMVPAAQLRNPFAGQRTWALRIGKLRIEWQ
jgi:hypothetical protein